MILLALLPSAVAGDSLRVVVAHEWGVRMVDSGSPMGPGVAGYVGYAFAARIARIVPEVGVGWAYNRNVIVPRVGGRLQIGWLLTPGIYAHGNMAVGDPFPAGTFGFDGGLSLDLALPYVHLGGFGGIQAFAGESGPDIPDLNFVGGVQVTLAIPTRRSKDEQE